MDDGWAKLYRDACNGYLAKGGEGSRGGEIIGHTKSGKPVYGGNRRLKSVLAGKNNLASRLRVVEKVKAAHPGWSSQDHEDAADIHERHLGNSPSTKSAELFHSASIGRHRHTAKHLRGEGK